MAWTIFPTPRSCSSSIVCPLTGSWSAPDIPEGTPRGRRSESWHNAPRIRRNRLGATIVRITGREGRLLHVQGLDAVDGTPVVDIKPVFAEFLPRDPVRQPEWSHELMRDYWTRAGRERPTSGTSGEPL